MSFTYLDTQFDCIPSETLHMMSALTCVLRYKVGTGELEGEETEWAITGLTHSIGFAATDILVRLL